MGATVTAVRSNPVPPGGITATEPAPPTALPASLEQLVEMLTPAITRFRRASVPMRTTLSLVQGLTPGETVTVRIQNVGLGVRVVREHTLTLTFSNSGTAAVTLNLSPWFPWNFITLNQVSINGGTTPYSASGVAGLLTALRTRRGSLALGASGLSPALVRVTSVGAGLTLNAAAGGYASGYKSVTIAASTSNATLTVVFYEILKFALDRNTLIGVLPLQNNSVFATISTTANPTLLASGTDETAPLNWGGAAGSGVTVTASDNIATDYEFWAVPSDPALYAPLVSNSYQINEQKAITTNATGEQAFKYEIPQNTYLIAMHFLGVDGNKQYLGIGDGLTSSMAGFTRFLIQYNGGSVIPVVAFPGRERARQFADYGWDPYQLPGYWLWDGTDTTDDLTESDQAGWIDTYYAASPEAVADVDPAATLPLTHSVVREVLVPGSVQVIGG